jgi:hypothetical protein
MPLITKAQARQMGISNPSLQTIEIPRDWTLKKSRDWLKSHGYLWQYHRLTTNFRRFAQTYDIEDAEFYSKKLPNDIVMVWQKY